MDIIVHMFYFIFTSSCFQLWRGGYYTLFVQQPLYFVTRNLHENELKNMSRQNFRLTGHYIGQSGCCSPAIGWTNCKTLWLVDFFNGRAL